MPAIGYRGLPRRVTSALSRRAKRAWRSLTLGDRKPLASAALEWLLRQGADDPAWPLGLRLRALETLWSYGQTSAIAAWLDALLPQQLPCGGFPERCNLEHAADTTPAAGRASIFNTGQALRGLLAIAEAFPAAHDAARRAAEFLAACIDDKGHIATPKPSSAAFDTWASPEIHLASLPSLLEASRRLHQPLWREAAWRAFSYYRRTADLCRWSMPSHWQALVIEAIIDLGFANEARHALALPAAMQRRDGSVPAFPGERWISTSGVAQLAIVWYKLGEAERANAAMKWLRRQQHPSGGFLGSHGPGACYFPYREVTPAAQLALDASLLEVQAAFSKPQETSSVRSAALQCREHHNRTEILPNKPTDLHPADGRLQAVCKALAHLPPGTLVADMGCGDGRYLRALIARFPRLRWLGLDASADALQHLPPQVERRIGSLLRLPLPDACLDAALAVESLEHTLVPRQAIAELGRVVRPGGQIIVIDKDRACQGLSQHEPWEVWFTADQVREWLSHSCEAVQVDRIAHGHPPRHGLFFCWTGRRRHAAEAARAA